ncbi:choline-sulfatase [Variovorax paradoxus]|uniref:Choline-sulfatase n=1 Tax=Variovorax paradoxus TaxID=34073 RepID=A0AAE3Y6U9_VARPD|nr:sulfatase-like hydrolase/transferase [Variovorax paradoxus]MDP9968614.1 choline-sulfatase [Variovorax paradoxus]MDR6430256.1 choline-sulfatase [Variovorax paradoxus]MDR6456245.1 choline-sulfatase [Variovorax paradoxus]
MPGKNVVVIMSDEHDPRIMGCSGHPFVKTPHLDALARRGIRFTNAYTPSPICVPARAAFATGLRVHQIRLWDNAMPYTGEQRGWGHVLQEHHVRVESIGKLHYRSVEDPAGFDEEHLPMHVVGGHGMVWASIRDPFRPRVDGPRMLGERIGAGESSYTQYDRAVTQRAVQWLKEAAARNEEHSFVLYVGLVAPHFPFVVPDEYFNLYPLDSLPEPKLHPSNGYQRHPWVQEYADFMGSEDRFADAQERLRAFAAFYGLCSWLDHNVGQIVRALDDSGLADSTQVIYTSDHGDNLGARGVWGKSTLYEESVKVPMLMAGPGITASVCETPVDLLDLFPTILEGAGIEPAPEMQDRPGRSLLEVAMSEPEPDRPILSEYHAAGSNSAGFMLRKGRWKYHHYVGFRPELFDLQEDPEELRDLAEDPTYAGVLENMRLALYAICDPQLVDRQAKADQAELIERHGGIDAAHKLGSSTSTPVSAKPEESLS